MLWASVPAVLFGVALTFVLLPVVVSVQAVEDGQDTALDLRFDIAPWWGALGLVLLRQSDTTLWQVRVRLLGHALGPLFALGKTAPRTARIGGDGGQTSTADATADEPGAVDRAPKGPELTLPQRLHRDGALIWTMVRPVWRMIASFPRAFSLHHLRVTARVGLSDPAVTGQLQGVVCALRAVLPERFEVDVESDFVDKGTRGEVGVCIHVQLSRLLYYILRTVLINGFHWVSARVSSWRSNRARMGARSGIA